MQYKMMSNYKVGIQYTLGFIVLLFSYLQKNKSYPQAKVDIILNSHLFSY